MDLVQTVRKEGSRGGRSEFKWEDVKQDSQRENYLGHSLMAPVGRWQQGRDLNWYAKGDDDDKQTAAEKLAEEKRKLKEAEQDAMLAAMGLPVPKREAFNANLTPLGEKAHEADVKDAIEDKAGVGKDKERKDRKDRTRKERRDRHDDGRRHRHRRSSRSRSRDRRDRKHDRSRSRDRRKDGDDDRRRHRSRSREHRHRDDRHERHSHRRETRADDRRRRSHSADRQRRRSRSPYDRHERRRD
ncbi:hypothetical protein BS50DRAFT_579433 [Corynespora cassiicola Philippines]|uniref:Multiple myeloma tumor-associated protein 2-like N-terminal domain-containing protein n=1 Tax=Corynespora cassiicola Philippines TaxID=1448308 RepID=A0A2T2N4A5_CORCC|nr:hypothetical protein BS50DRAFT_579433 [Corynespora cassiicola Philippines]